MKDIVFTINDERKGVVKTYWEEVRARVTKAAPEFAKIVDDLSPDKSFPLYLAYYPYGDLIGDTISPFLPTIEGGSYRLNDANIPKDIINHLGYGKNSAPMGLLLENTLEFFCDFKELDLTIPWRIFSPGAFFPLTRLFPNQKSRIYTPNGIVSTTSGGRSVFMLPKIGCLTNHFLLQKRCNVQSPPPKSLYDHWRIFKEIAQNNKQCDWRSCVLYFSKKWVDKINYDKKWDPVKRMLLEKAWHSHEYERSYIYCNVAYSLIQYKRNLKPNPYLVDTACHLFMIPLGLVPGYVPLCTEDLLPLELIQAAIVEGYEMKKYIPTLMGPQHFSFEEDKLPIYYSLQSPSTLSFSPKSRKLSSTIFEMRELKHIINVFTAELAKENSLMSDTIFNEVAKKIEFIFYHNKQDKHNYIQPANEIAMHDKRFSAKYTAKHEKGAVFSCDAPFVRGCISIGVKQ